MMLRNLISLAIAIAPVTAALAEPVDFSTADQMLFDPDGAEVAIFPDAGLSDEDRQRIAVVGSQQVYYGAFAISPDEGLLSEATAAVANFNSADAAMRAALTECNTRRKSGTAQCVPAAHIRPKGWEARTLQLSATGTEAVRGDYRALPSPKAFAASQSTGGWAMTSGSADDAVSECASKTGAEDCTVVLRD
ncbi:5-aminolevulic acid synthase [Qingshengfaniella alkalisoli]|uniref:5-aminolevulic acid synthase n=1 Tax=Qingshengfaniella alkalisoli TaxID=2599296 RepID=A0A5B8IWG1_9RHOB|nr:5-aminolevulic acid synthase [Qingshengfaniella alkalisoli]QDY68868.1 5-aminolevulic acid synthase [Qingshengfaniella alkalisoli]